jgi:hypothetical protein
MLCFFEFKQHLLLICWYSNSRSKCRLWHNLHRKGIRLKSERYEFMWPTQSFFLYRQPIDPCTRAWHCAVSSPWSSLRSVNTSPLIVDVYLLRKHRPFLRSPVFNSELACQLLISLVAPLPKVSNGVVLTASGACLHTIFVDTDGIFKMFAALYLDSPTGTRQ